MRLRLFMEKSRGFQVGISLPFSGTATTSITAIGTILADFDNFKTAIVNSFKQVCNIKPAVGAESDVR